MSPSISFENVCLDGTASASGRLLRGVRLGKAAQIGEAPVIPIAPVALIARIVLISAPATAHEQDGTADQQPEGDNADPDGGAGAGHAGTAVGPADGRGSHHDLLRTHGGGPSGTGLGIDAHGG